MWCGKLICSRSLLLPHARAVRELHGEMGMGVNLLASRSFGFVLFLESVNFASQFLSEGVSAILACDVYILSFGFLFEFFTIL